jgi:hypothetical protein
VHFVISCYSTMERFHSTIAVVPETFPVAKYLQEVNSQISQWTNGLGPIVVKEFESLFPPHKFDAHN